MNSFISTKSKEGSREIFVFVLYFYIVKDIYLKPVGVAILRLLALFLPSIPQLLHTKMSKSKQNRMHHMIAKKLKAKKASSPFRHFELEA